VTLYAGSQEEISQMAITFSVRRAAEQCGLSERTIHAQIKLGHLKVLRVGRRVLVSPEALRKFLKDRTQDSEASAP
jgi:excisionase family DNA binding protein